MAGIAKASRAVAFADKLSESPLESISRVAFHEFGLPASQPQAWIKTEPVMFRVDFLWREYRTIGEADGKAKYADPSVIWDEKTRQEDISDLGFEFVRWTWEIDKHPDRVPLGTKKHTERALILVLRGANLIDNARQPTRVITAAAVTTATARRRSRRCRGASAGQDSTASHARKAAISPRARKPTTPPAKSPTRASTNMITGTSQAGSRDSRFSGGALARSSAPRRFDGPLDTVTPPGGRRAPSCRACCDALHGASAEARPFLDQAKTAVAILAGHSGYVRGRIGRSADDPECWVISMEWISVGAYRRAIGPHDGRLPAAPLLCQAHDEPTAYEIIYANDAGSAAEYLSDRPADADTVSRGAAGPWCRDRF